MILADADIPSWLAWLQAWATIGLGAAGAAFAGVQARASWATHKANEATRAEAAKRARLTLDVSWSELQPTFEGRWGKLDEQGTLVGEPDVATPVLQIAISNVGERVARHVEVRVDLPASLVDRPGWSTQRGNSTAESGFDVQLIEGSSEIDGHAVGDLLRLRGTISQIAPGDAEHRWLRLLLRAPHREELPIPARVTTRCDDDDNVPGAALECRLPLPAP